MQKAKGRIGGFVGQNRGSIKNCYGVAAVKGGSALSGGFAAENSGGIELSYSSSTLRSLTGGFVGLNTGSADKCWFIHSEPENSKTLSRLSDADMAMAQRELRSTADYAKLGFDTKIIWEKGDSNIPLWFIAGRWYLNTPTDGGKIIDISTADELFEFAGRVNAGEADSRSAHVRLTENIDLRGEEWAPIGPDADRAFTGVFDGAGHTVSNFAIRRSGMKNKGFFGCLKGAVYNLSVDCIVSEAELSGGIAAENKGSIVCCGAVVEIKCRSGVAGGLVGRNTGKIFASYAAGKVGVAVIPLIPIVCGAAGLLAVCAAAVLLLGENGFFGGSGDKGLTVFAPVPYDEDQIPIEDEVIEPNTDGNFVSFQFEQEIAVDLATGHCTFNFKNPGDSNHNTVVQLQFTDAQAVRVMGSTGRTAEEQATLEADPGYDPENYRMVLAESGAIRPGYELTDLRLVQQPNGATLPPGNYNAVIYLMFYDIDTNNRAMLESQLPVVISVQ